MSKYFVGDRVRVINPGSLFRNEIGEIVRVFPANDAVGPMATVRMDSGPADLAFEYKDIELAEVNTPDA